MTLKERFTTEIGPKIRQELGSQNSMAVPRIMKIVVNVGMGQAVRDPKVSESVAASLARMTGQRPVRTLARKSIATFKIREGMAIGTMVTIRGKRMWDFLERLIRVTLPRVRDFRGISQRAVDRGGNLSIGFREHLVFPEIRADEVEHLHGVQVTVVTNAGTRERGLALFRALGVPFQEAVSRQPQGERKRA